MCCSVNVPESWTTSQRRVSSLINYVPDAVVIPLSIGLWIASENVVLNLLPIVVTLKMIKCSFCSQMLPRLRGGSHEQQWRESVNVIDATINQHR